MPFPPRPISSDEPMKFNPDWRPSSPVEPVLQVLVDLAMIGLITVLPAVVITWLIQQ